MIDLNKYSKHIILTIIGLSVLLGLGLAYRNIVLDNSFRFSALLDDRYIFNTNGESFSDSEIKEIIETKYFNNHTLIVGILVEFVSLSGTNIAFLIFLTLKITFIFLIFKFFKRYINENKSTLNGILLLFASSSFFISTSNYLLDIFSFIIFGIMLLYKAKSFNTIINADSNSNYGNLIHYNIFNGLINGFLAFVFSYINPINIVLVPLFGNSGNMLKKKYTLTYFITFILLNLIFYSVYDYNLIKSFDFIIETNHFDVPNLFILKNYLGLLVFMFLFYYLMIFKKWKSGISGLINFEIYYSLLIFIILTFNSNYFLNMYIFTMLFVVITPYISNVLTYYKNSDSENNKAILNFFVLYFLINLYLVSNFF